VLTADKLKIVHVYKHSPSLSLFFAFLGLGDAGGEERGEERRGEEVRLRALLRVASDGSEWCSYVTVRHCLTDETINRPTR
jgi:hypothetical protein